MKTMLRAALAAAVVVAPAAYAQEPVALPAAPPATAVIAEAPTTNAVLRAGTPVVLRMMEEITTKKKAARVGHLRHRPFPAARLQIRGKKMNL